MTRQRLIVLGNNRFYFRFNEELEKPEYADIDASLRAQFLRRFHDHQNAMEASDSWFDIWAEKGNDYDESGGDFNLNWKDNGYKTLFDILTVSSSLPFGIEIFN